MGLLSCWKPFLTRAGASRAVLTQHKKLVFLLSFLVISVCYSTDICSDPSINATENNSSSLEGSASQNQQEAALFDFSFQSMDMQYVLSELASIANAELQTTTPLHDKVNLQLKQISVASMLHYLLQSYGLDFHEQVQEGGKKQWIIGKPSSTNHSINSPNTSQKPFDTIYADTDSFNTPLITQYFSIKYYDTKALAELIGHTPYQLSKRQQPGYQSKDRPTEVTYQEGFLSKKATILVDERSRQIIIHDSKERLEQIAEIIKKLDIPQKQILLEAHIVMAKTSAAKDLGVRWGTQVDHGKIMLGTLPNSAAQNKQNQNNPTNSPNRFTTSLAVDLGALNEAAARFQTNYKSSNTLIELELSALELEGQINIISKPKVAAIDGEVARISSGVEVPYIVSDKDEINTSFKEATLSLEVKAKIVENENITMDININQDAIGTIYNGMPSIDTNKLHTQLSTSNQNTVVLGGILQSRQIKQVSKVPLLGDIPILQWLFKRESQLTEKAELLIFITPQIID